MEPTYHLEGIIHSKEEMEDFEGPLNLILMLLSKNKIEIRDIQISQILEQYLDYLAQMEAMDLEIASEFVQMASHLLYIKTKMLLSSQEEVSELELLMSSLEQLKTRDVYGGIKEITGQLAGAAERGARLYTKQPEPLPTKGEYVYRHESWELMRALLNVYTRSSSAAPEEEPDAPRKRIVPRPIVYNVRDKSIEIINRFRREKSFYLRTLYDESHSRSEVVATFLSVLELCSKGDVILTLNEDDIVLSFGGESVDSVLETINE